MSNPKSLAFLLALSQVFCIIALPMNPPMSSSTELDHKRSYYIDPGGNSPFKPWPISRLVWCLNAPAPNPNFETLMWEVWNMWNQAVAGDTSFVIIYTGLCLTDVIGSNLWITLTNDQSAVTTLGFSGAGLPAKNTMNFDMSAVWGTNSPIVNLAHEVGHAMGLAHEHQKPSAWKSDPLGGNPNPLLKFNCMNLKDYDEHAALGENMEALCTSQSVASASLFSAADILPFTALTFIQSPDFDWDSIMLDSSKAGAKEVDGAILPVLTRFDGSIILANMRPSASDALALRTLYP